MCLGSGWNCSEIHSELLEEHEGEDGLGSQSHKGRNVALKQKKYVSGSIKILSKYSKILLEVKPVFTL